MERLFFEVAASQPLDLLEPPAGRAGKVTEDERTELGMVAILGRRRRGRPHLLKDPFPFGRRVVLVGTEVSGTLVQDPGLVQHVLGGGGGPLIIIITIASDCCLLNALLFPGSPEDDRARPLDYEPPGEAGPVLERGPFPAV